MKTKFKKSRFKKPYTSTGKAIFHYTSNKSGVYVIRKNLKIVYVGFSARNLYKTMYRHFQEWNHKSQPVVTYVNQLKRNRFDVSVTLTTPAKAARLEKGLIKLLKPVDNPNKYRAYIATETEKTLANDWIESSTIKDADLPF